MARSKSRSRSRNRRRFAPRRARRGGRRTIPVVQTIGALVAAGEVVNGLPNTINALKAGDVMSAAYNIRGEGGALITPSNVILIATPVVAAGLLAKGLRMVGVSAPKLGRFRLF